MRFFNIKAKSNLILKIIFGKYNHFLIINIEKDNLEKMLKGEDYIVVSQYYGLRNYLYWKIIKQLSSTVSEIDMVCEKANFERIFKKK